jgi:hypothetical protein
VFLLQRGHIISSHDRECRLGDACILQQLKQLKQVKQGSSGVLRGGKEVNDMMEGPWFGIVVMVLIIVGGGVWIWHTMRSDKKDKNKE